jgi:hypothetical protein
MKKLSMAVTVCSLLMTSGALAQTVKVNWQIDAPFADYRSYTWKESKNKGGTFYRQWVEKDVDAILSEKGFHKVAEDEHPDL